MHDQADDARLLFTGSRIIFGDRRSPLDRGAVLVRGDRLEYVGPAIEAPADAVLIDASGATIMPAILDVHGHAGYLKGGSTASEHFSEENVLDHLRRLTYHGVSTIQSLGTDRDGVEISIRDRQRSGDLTDPELATLLSAGAGITAPTPGEPNGGPFFATDVVREVSTPDEARAIVVDLARQRPDILKFWVDDRDGTKAKLKPDVYRAIIETAKEHGIRTAAHVFYLEDAKDVVRAGVDAIAHTVRTPGTDDELLELMVEHGVTGLTSVSIQRAGVRGWDWLDDPLLAETVDAEARASIRAQLDAAAVRTPNVFSPESYAILEENLRRYAEAGVRFVLSGDTGVLSSFWGFGEHRELEAISDAGLGPEAAIRAGTSDAAEFLGLRDRGTLDVGKRADLLVLDADPLADIRNTRRIRDVVLGGVRLDRAAMRRRWS